MQRLTGWTGSAVRVAALAALAVAAAACGDAGFDGGALVADANTPSDSAGGADVSASDLGPADAAGADASLADTPSPDGTVGFDSVGDDATSGGSDAVSADVGGGCTSTKGCALGQYCKVSQCGVPGVCVGEVPSCNASMMPVCGCDGVTYPSDCALVQAGVGKSADGACTILSCEVGNSADCPTGSFCDGACGTKGSCQPTPSACSKELAPVCGCDGQTYSNACMANKAGIAVAASGACPATKSCGGFVGDTCGVGQWCEKNSCYFNAPGVCVDKPTTGCPKVYAPVCGCDGLSYDNDCFRQLAGVSKDHDGACDMAPGSCDVSDPSACGKGEFCASNAGVCGGLGTCTAMPGGCIELYQPVCGCDGKTYGNACSAASAGMNVAYDGECGTTEPATCGGFVGKPCPSGMVCDPDGCGADMMGKCVPEPNQPCPKTTSAAQQCGCDGVTYANECLRLMVGVGKANDGPCAGECVLGANDCASDAFCSAPGQCSGTGVCAKKPGGCLAVYDPVCGCNGQTYSNACEAEMQGRNWVKGECKAAAGCGGAGPCPFGYECSGSLCLQCNKICPAIACAGGMVQDPCTCQCVAAPK